MVKFRFPPSLRDQTTRSPTDIFFSITGSDPYWRTAKLFASLEIRGEDLSTHCQFPPTSIILVGVRQMTVSQKHFTGRHLCRIQTQRKHKGVPHVYLRYAVLASQMNLQAYYSAKPIEKSGEWGHLARLQMTIGRKFRQGDICTKFKPHANTKERPAAP